MKKKHILSSAGCMGIFFLNHFYYYSKKFLIYKWGNFHISPKMLKSTNITEYDLPNTPSLQRKEANMMKTISFRQVTGLHIDPSGFYISNPNPGRPFAYTRSPLYRLKSYIFQVKFLWNFDIFWPKNLRNFWKVPLYFLKIVHEKKLRGGKWPALPSPNAQFL
jgi:hypothetical protein